MEPKYSKTFISIDTARRMAKYLWSINDTPHWYHQTLTFSGNDPARHDVKLATARLNALLDQLDKARPDCACIWVRERQWNKGIHFHVILLFFGERAKSPKTLHRELRADVFGRWNALNGGDLFQGANRMTMPPYRAKNVRSFGYLTADVRIDDTTQRATRGGSWWGRRNEKLIAANSTRLSKRDASAALSALFKWRRKYVRRGPARTKAPAVAKSSKNSFNFRVHSVDVAEWRKLVAPPPPSAFSPADVI
jgi:hypothetical protein